MKKSLFILFLMLIGLISACNLQTSTTVPAATGQLTDTDDIEVIVFSWDWPMKANIPPIHIWENGRAVWVEWETVSLHRYRYHIYETFLSKDEMLKVKETIRVSGFWEDERPEALISDVSTLVLWARSSGITKSVYISELKYETALSSLREILNESPLKSEYYPTQGYLFTKQDEPFLTKSSFPWPNELEFDFSKHNQSLFIDEEILSTIWIAVQQNYNWISYQGNAYDYSLKIPGVSCVINDDPYICTMYDIEEVR
jgi:hypothetical protein